MANPQCENGYTKISNEILDALCKTRINGEARQCLDLIIRKTYGFNKKRDKISLSQFVENTGVKKTNICRSIIKLKNMKIIIQIQDDRGSIYEFNKNYEEWEVVPKKSSPQIDNELVPKLITEVVPKMRHTKESITKERNTYAYNKNFKDTYKTKDKIYKQLGKEYKPPKKTSAQEKSITGMKLLDYFRDKAMELHRINYLSRPEDKNKQMVKKAIECFERFETKEKCLELVDWYLAGYGEWNKYEPTTCFMSKTYQAFENKDVEVKKKEQKDYIYIK